MVVINLYNQLLIVYLTYCGHVISNKSGIEFVPLIALKESASIALKETAIIMLLVQVLVHCSGIASIDNHKGEYSCTCFHRLQQLQ